MSARRRSTISSPSTTAADISKSVELEQRVARIELLLKDIQQALDGQTKRTTALQAHLDHVAAKFGCA